MKPLRDDLGRPSPNGNQRPGPEPKFWHGLAFVLILVGIALGAWYLWK